MQVTRLEQFVPHLRIEYSKGLEDRIDMNQVCRKLSAAMMKSGIFPLGGIRVRAFATDAFTVSDDHRDNSFVDLVLRLGEGRTIEEKQISGNRIFETCKEIFKSELGKPHFALSLEFVEINSSVSWKLNTMHERLS
jgi:5-carboxymethyl-2-hydroxymuconate isomerase